MDRQLFHGKYYSYMFYQEAIVNMMIIRFPYAIVSQNGTTFLHYVGGCPAIAW